MKFHNKEPITFTWNNLQPWHYTYHIEGMKQWEKVEGKIRLPLTVWSNHINRQLCKWQESD